MPDPTNTTTNSASSSVPPTPILTDNNVDIPPIPESVINPSASDKPAMDTIVVTSDSSNSNAKKGSKKRNAFIATIFGLLLLVGGVGAGLILTQQNQEIREKAAPITAVNGNSANLTCRNSKRSVKLTPSKDEYVLNPTTNKWTLTTTYHLEDTRESLCRDPQDDRCVVDPDKVETTVKLVAITCFCNSGTYANGSVACNDNCFINSDPNLPLSQFSDPKAIPIEHQKVFTLEGPGSRYAINFDLVRETSSVQCGKFQTDITILSVNGELDKAGCTGSEDAYTTYKTDIDCTQPPANPTNTPIPSTPPTALAAQCNQIKAYKIPAGVQTTEFDKWVQLTAADLAKLKTGEKVYFTVEGKSTNDAKSGGGFDKARFSINGATATEVTTVRAKAATTVNETTINYQTEYYYQYTIPTETTTFKVDAQIHHVTKGWM